MGKDLDALSDKLNELVLKLEATKECKNANEKLESLYETIGAFLPEEQKKLIFEVDDCFTEILIMYEDYFYKNGYQDCQRSKGLIKRIFSSQYHK